jgi:site-specific DNA-methyltransferase (adenine-specific)
MIKSYYKSVDKKFNLLYGDCFKLLTEFDFKFNLIFADPPYFLSNNGLSVQNGKIVSVNKGDWDKSYGIDYIYEFNFQWLSLVREKMKDDATIWISGTVHNIFSIGQILNNLDFKILNLITWEKSNPPPNFSRRYFTHSSEIVIWARKYKDVPHYYNYDLMKIINDNKQMKDIWKLPAVAKWEKSCGNHPTQKPLSLLTRIILSSTKENDWVLDPFAGSSTTGVAANLQNRKYLGIDKEIEYLEISKNRKLEIENLKKRDIIFSKIKDLKSIYDLNLFNLSEPSEDYSINLPF